MPLGKRQRKLFLGSGLMMLAGAAFWLALPVWLPWLLRPLAARRGIHYSTYTREGYSRFKLAGVTLTNRTTRFSAHTLEALVPSVWLWRLATRNHPAAEPFLRVEGWHFISMPAAEPSTPVYAQAQEFLSLSHKLKKWLPVARLENGSIQLSETLLSVPKADWSAGLLQTTALLPPPIGPLALSADLSGTPPFQFEVTSDPLRLHSRLRFLPGPAGLDVQSTTLWWSNQIDFYAQFTRTSNVPELASLKAKQFVIPAQVIDLSPYLELAGNLMAQWHRDAFDLDLKVSSQPSPATTHLPPLTLNLHARGNGHSATIQTAQLSAPWLSATLSRELTVYFRGPILREPAQLKLAADLSRQNWFPLQGELQGEAQFAPAEGRLPRAHFQLAGSDIGNRMLTARALRLAGDFDWPHLALTNVSAQFADDSRASAAAELDLLKRSVSDGTLDFSGPLANRWLLPACSLRHMSLSIHFDGPFGEIAQRGRLQITDFTSPNLRPLGLNATWTGHKQSIDQFQLELAAGAARLQAQGGFTNLPTSMSLRLDALSLLTNAEPVLHLDQPIRIVFQPSRGQAGWRVQSSPLDWVGTNLGIHCDATLDWPQSGHVNCSLDQVSTRLFAGFTADTSPELEIPKLNASVNWSNSPASYSVLVSSARLAPAQITESTNSFRWIPFATDLNLHGDADGLTLSNLLVYSRTSTVVRIRGFLPMTLAPAAVTNRLRLEPRKQLELSAQAEPHAFFWKEFTAWTGVTLEDPQLKLQLSGDWEKPRGELELNTRELRLQKTVTNFPTLTDLKIRLQLDQNQARLLETHLLVQGQPVLLTAQIPLGENFWNDLKAKKLPDWNEASAQLGVRDAELAALEPLVPNILTPQGSLDLDLSLSPGLKLAGEMTIENARTRPLGDFGPIRDVNIKCRFRDRDLTIESFSAQISGAPLKVTGHADLTGTQWLKGQLPPFTLKIHGTNVPLARQPEVVIRSDLDLTTARTNGAPPLISGIVHLHDSFFLAELADLIPGKVAESTRQPPYFSIQDPFLAGWRLVVKAEGVRFLKVRTPVFNGEISANLTLQGTLQDPIALGDLRVDSGLVRFPFGSLQVQQGLITSSSADPYHPQLTVTAASKQFGYDVRMEVTGPADAPVIQFNSTPPLSSEQILLMVTAGQMPQGTFTLTPQQRAQTMAMFFGRDLLSKLGLGDQTQERLMIRSGEEISEQGRPTYHVEYRLSQRWSLVGEYDRFGDFNAGFKWRILSR